MTTEIRLAPPTNLNGSWDKSTAAEASHTFPAGASANSKGMLTKLVVSNTAGAVRWIWVFDSATATGNPLLPPIPIAATNGYVDLPLPYGVPFGVNLTVASSTSGTTFTAGGADFWIGVGWGKRTALS